MSCPTAQELLRFADESSATREEAADIAAHLAECLSCRIVLGEWREAEAALRGAVDDVPEGYFEGLPSRIEARLGTPAPVVVFRARRPAVVRWALAAAAALLVAVVSPWLVRESGIPRLTQGPAKLEEDDRSSGLRAPQGPSAQGGVTAPAAPAASLEPSAGPSAGERLARVSVEGPRGLPPGSADALDRVSEERAPAGTEKGRVGAEEKQRSPGGAQPGSHSEALPVRAPAPLPVVPEKASAAEVAAESPSPDGSAALPPRIPTPVEARLEMRKDKSALSAPSPQRTRQDASLLARERAQRLETKRRSVVDPIEADEAWAGSVEAWFEAWRLGAVASDREAALASARAYLGASGSRQKPRVRRVLEALGETE